MAWAMRPWFRCFCAASTYLVLLKAMNDVLPAPARQEPRSSRAGPQAAGRRRSGSLVTLARAPGVVNAAQSGARSASNGSVGRLGWEDQASSGKASWVAPAAQQEAARTGANENRCSGVGP